MRERMQLITEKTGIPIGAVAALLAFVVSATAGTTIWITTVNYRLSSIERDVRDIKMFLDIKTKNTVNNRYSEGDNS